MPRTPPSDFGQHIQNVGYVVPTSEIATFLAARGPWVEIGAGTGAMAEAIRTAGGRIVATDNHSWQLFNEGRPWNELAKRTIRADAERAARLVSRHLSLGLLCSWPTHSDDWCYRAVRHLRVGQKFAYIGERFGTSSGDAQLKALIEDRFEEVETFDLTAGWNGIYDRLTIYQRTV